MDFDPSTVFPGPGAIIRTIIMGTGGSGGMSLLIVAVILAGVAMRPIFILLGMRFDRRVRSRESYRPAFLLLIAASIFVIIPLIQKPHLAQLVLKTRIPVSALLGSETRHPTGAKVCTPGAGCMAPAGAVSHEEQAIVAAETATQELNDALAEVGQALAQ